MNGTADHELLTRYARKRDEGAFAELVRRQMDELLRLRGEVAQLRQATRDARNGPAAAPNAGVAAKVESEDLVKAMQAADAVAVRTVNAQKHLGLALHVDAIAHQGQLPTSIEELKPILGDVLDPDGMVTGVPLELFEFHVHGRAVGISEPEKILLREKQARRHLGTNLQPGGRFRAPHQTARRGLQRVRKGRHRHIGKCAEAAVGKVLLASPPTRKTMGLKPLETIPSVSP